MVEIKIERYRRIRGKILRLLIKWHPAPLNLEELHALLDDLGYSITREELESHLVYLEEPGYIKIEKRMTERIESKKIRILKKGIDINDGVGPEDVGIIRG
jgi:hypothetical protein